MSSAVFHPGDHAYYNPSGGQCDNNYAIVMSEQYSAGGTGGMCAVDMCVPNETAKKIRSGGDSCTAKCDPGYTCQANMATFDFTKSSCTGDRGTTNCFSK